jgi:hypothetical protein
MRARLLLYYNTTNSIVALFPVVLLSGELEGILELPFLGEPQFWAGMLVAAVMGYLINIASFLQIKYTSPLTHMISGTAKGAVQTVLSVMIFGNPITSLVRGSSSSSSSSSTCLSSVLTSGPGQNAMGTLVVIGGSAWYSHIRYQEMQQAPKADKPSDAAPPAVTAAAQADVELGGAGSSGPAAHDGAAGQGDAEAGLARWGTAQAQAQAQTSK